MSAPIWNVMIPTFCFAVWATGQDGQRPYFRDIALIFNYENRFWLLGYILSVRGLFKKKPNFLFKTFIDKLTT
jgi:hypothetical protein